MKKDPDELQVYNGVDLGSYKRHVNCILQDIPQPGLTNFSFKVLPIAMNDEKCPTLTCVPEPGQVTHGYGSGIFHGGHTVGCLA